MAVQAGRLRHRVEVQTLSGSTSASGRGLSQKTFTTAETVRADVQFLNGREGLLAKQLVPSATHRVHVRYSSNIDETARLKFGSRYLNIISVERVDERQREMWLLCGEEK